MKTQILSRRWPPLRRTAVLALVSLVGLLSIIVTATTLFERSHTTDNVPVAAAAGPLAATSRSPRDFWNQRVDRWRAEARTVVAAIRYLLEPDPPIGPGWPYRYSELAMPTNSTSLAPKV